jgi:hypothetical protein
MARRAWRCNWACVFCIGDRPPLEGMPDRLSESELDRETWWAAVLWRLTNSDPPEVSSARPTTHRATTADRGCRGVYDEQVDSPICYHSG